MGAPAASNAHVMDRRSDNVTPAIGSASNAEAPPESSTNSVSLLPSGLTSRRNVTAASSPSASGRGCPPRSTVRCRSGSGTGTPCGVSTSIWSAQPGCAFSHAAASPGAALPRATNTRRPPPSLHRAGSSPWSTLRGWTLSTASRYAWDASRRSCRVASPSTDPAYQRDRGTVTVKPRTTPPSHPLRQRTAGRPPPRPPLHRGSRRPRSRPRNGLHSATPDEGHRPLG